MSIEFIGSPRPTLGVELELQLVNPATKDLAAESVALLDLCRRRGLERVKAEITQSMVEIDTEISADVKECRAHLAKRIAQLQAVAREIGVELAVSGTHPFQCWRERKIFPNSRYRYLLQKFRWLAARLNVYGLHVHVGVRSGADAIAISNAAIRYLPHLLALSASSPYWEGVDTGLHSCRAGVMESFPISGLPYYFPNWQEFEKYCDTLLHTGAIASLKDIYWFIRPSPAYGTLEFRVCDGIPTLSETMAIVALIQTLVVWIDEGLRTKARSETISMRRYWIAPENLWVAARDGLDGMIIVNEEGKRRKISDDILNLMEHLAPIAKRLNCYEELSFLAEIIRQGSSAKRQRALFRQTQSLEAVVGALVNEFATGMPDMEEPENLNLASLPRRPTPEVARLSTVALRHRARADLRRYH
jgi:carboxylate-amine ligase